MRHQGHVTPVADFVGNSTVIDTCRQFPGREFLDDQVIAEFVEWVDIKPS
jgi:hypothetical protein